MTTIDPEFIRTNPGMFIGNIWSEGLHQLLFGLIDDFANEYRLGFSKNLKLSVLINGSVCIKDNGRMIEPRFLEELFVKSRSKKYPDLDSKLRGLWELYGTMGMTLSAISECCEVFLRDGNQFHRIRYSQGNLKENWSTIAIRNLSVS